MGTTNVTFATVFSVLTMVGGVAYAVAALDFSWLALASGLASNATFSLRGMYSNSITRPLDTTPVNLFTVITILSACLVLPMAFVMEGEHNACAVFKKVPSKVC